MFENRTRTNEETQGFNLNNLNRGSGPREQERSDHDTGLHHGSVDLADGVDEAGISVGEVLLYSNFPVLANGRSHYFFQARVNNVDLISTFNLANLISESHELEESLLGLLLIFLGHTAWGNVIEVL